MSEPDKKNATSLDELARKKTSTAAGFYGFFASSKKWWLLPPLVMLVILGLIFMLSGTVAAPFIYTLF